MGGVRVQILMYSLTVHLSITLANDQLGVQNFNTLLHLVGFLCMKDSLLCTLNYSVCVKKTSQKIN